MNPSRPCSRPCQNIQHPREQCHKPTRAARNPNFEPVSNSLPSSPPPWTRRDGEKWSLQTPALPPNTRFHNLAFTSQYPSSVLRDLIYPYYKNTFFFFKRYVLSSAIPLLLTISKSKLSRVCVTDLELFLVPSCSTPAAVLGSQSAYCSSGRLFGN